jgi:hypothetical protein
MAWLQCHAEGDFALISVNLQLTASKDMMINTAKMGYSKGDTL